MLKRFNPVRPLLHLLLLLPFLEIVWQIQLLYAGQANRLGPDPGKFILEAFATYSLQLLVVGLSLSPLYRLFRWKPIMAYRRMTGLWAFTYAVLHLISYCWFILGWDFALIGGELIQRPYIWPGMAALIILLLMAMTSYRKAIRILGRRWIWLHRMIYPAALLVVWHAWWQSKEATTEPMIYGLIVTALLSERVVRKIVKK